MDEELTYSENLTVKTPKPSKKKRKRSHITEKTSIYLDDQPLLNTTINIQGHNIKNFENFTYKNLSDLLSMRKDIGNRNVAKIFDVSRDDMSQFYVVNESLFLYHELTMISDEDCQDYRLYKVMMPKSGSDVDQNDDELTAGKCFALFRRKRTASHN